MPSGPELWAPQTNSAITEFQEVRLITFNTNLVRLSDTLTPLTRVCCSRYAANRPPVDPAIKYTVEHTAYVPLDPGKLGRPGAAVPPGAACLAGDAAAFLHARGINGLS